MENEFMIPANSKRSLLIFGLFKPFDMGLFSIGLGLTFILLVSIQLTNVVMSLVAISPGLITGFLVLPLPNYYNVRSFIMNAWRFYTTRQKFIWKGWCVLSDENR